MKLIISPAKKMRTDVDGFPPEGLPLFVEEAARLRDVLTAMPPQALQALWKCNDAIARQNVERLEHMDLTRRLTPALFAYEGIQYQYMAPGVLDRQGLSYLRDHLRILSGFYGLLRPFDGVTPYRLEMQAKLSVDGKKDLYAFWGDRLAKALAAETDTVINLASKEYSRAVEPHLPSGVTFLTCTFAVRKGDKLAEAGTLCKMARGEMVRFLAEEGITHPEDLRGFCRLDYAFAPEHSTPEHYVFVKGGS